MARQLSDEELAQKRRDADLRERVCRIFSDNDTVRFDALDALKEAWCYNDPCFNLEELASMSPEASSLAAMRRSTVKEFIDWLAKLK